MSPVNVVLAKIVEGSGTIMLNADAPSFVPTPPSCDRLLGLRKTIKVLLLHPFLFVIPKKAFNEPIRFRRIRRDKFLW